MAGHAVTRIWRTTDSSRRIIPAAELLRINAGRNPAATQARIARQFIDINSRALSAYGIDAELTSARDGHIGISLATDSRIGALPLRSPSSGDVEHGLVIAPRFGWSGVGTMLSSTGAKVIPELPRLPMLPRSELSVPPWIISAVVLNRLEQLLRISPRRFCEVSDLCDRPRGRVHWNEYISEHVALSHPERLPCSFSALQDDQGLLGAVHATVLKQLQSLASVRSDTLIVRRLLERYEALRQAVRGIPPRWSGIALNAGAQRNAQVQDAVEAMQWTQNDRGLGGCSPAQGLPWLLSMDEVFEVWLELVVRELARLSGGIVRCGRKRETIRALAWKPPYTGSQRYLLPDVEVVRDDETVIFDAKYKSHWEEIDEDRWHGVSNRTRETHRADVLQVLAYAGATSSPRVTCVLVYPCHEATWASLRQRQRQCHTAEVPSGTRSIRLLLVALPLSGSYRDLAANLARHTARS